MVRLAETPSLPLSLGLSACLAPAWWELLGLSDENLRLHSVRTSVTKISLPSEPRFFSGAFHKLKSRRLWARVNGPCLAALLIACQGSDWHYSYLLRAVIRPALPRPVITPVISLPANPIDASRVGP